jgi:hypothetical protein
MEKWVAWFKELGATGHLKDPGHPLEGSGKEDDPHQQKSDPN